MDGNLSLTDFIAMHKYFAVYCVQAEGLLTPWNLVCFWLKSLEILTEISKSLPKSQISNLKTLHDLEIFREIPRFRNLVQIFLVINP